MDSRSALVLYASVTGNAQEGADEVSRILTRLHFGVHTCAFDDVDVMAMSAYTVVVCSVATTGQGEFPGNAKSFWKKLLRKKLSPNCLSQALFAIFGFGDSSYPRYNWAALKLRKRLLQLGACELLSMGQGDEQHPEGHESAFLPWCNELRQHVLQMLPLKHGSKPIPDEELLEPFWLLSLQDDEPVKTSPGNQEGSHGPRSSTAVSKEAGIAEAPPSDSLIVDLRLEENRRLTPESHWQDVRQLTFSTPAKADYLPGDVLAIYPKNATEDVNHIISLMSWSHVADRPLAFRRNPYCQIPSGSSPSSPSQTLATKDMTLRQYLTEHADLNAIPRRYFFTLLAHFTTDDFQKDRLLEFTDPQYVDELYDYTTRPRRSIIEVLQEFDTVKIPWQWAATVLPELRGRQFSIASGGKLKNGDNGSTRFELLVAIVKYRTVIRKLRRGVCTRYLEGLEIGSTLQALLQKGGLRITQADLERPILMIGPGTGVAPIRSLIWQRLAWAEKGGKRLVGNADASQRSLTGENVLFFGCRNEKADYFFKTEWDTLKEDLPLRVFAAFSRDPGNKQYVQHLIRTQSQAVYDIICQKDGIVFVCGSSGKMPQAVREALVAVLETAGPLDRRAAESYVASMERDDRYKQETW